jgi:Uncharacterized protein related to plant photosystem II stability/assembly factor
MESPLEKGVIWTGSDDGYVSLTRDGGANWKNVTPQGLQECLINAIEVSPFDKATAYIATTRYKFNDHTPGLYKTTDYGNTWTKITNGLPADAFTRVVREDNVRKDLLFAGTELGLFVSWNGGADWAPFQLNLPITPITDLRIYKGNLIAATSGRSYWILDDLSVIRQYKKDSPSFAIFKPDGAYLVNGSSELDSSNPEFTGANGFRGVNPQRVSLSTTNCLSLKRLTRFRWRSKTRREPSCTLTRRRRMKRVCVLKMGQGLSRCCLRQRDSTDLSGTCVMQRSRRSWCSYRRQLPVTQSAAGKI